MGMLTWIMMAGPILIWLVREGAVHSRTVRQRARRDDLYMALLGDASASGRLYTAGALLHVAQEWERERLPHQRKLDLIRAGFTPDDAHTDLVHALDVDSLTLIAALRGVPVVDDIIDLRDH